MAGYPTDRARRCSKSSDHPYGGGEGRQGRVPSEPRPLGQAGRQGQSLVPRRNTQMCLLSRRRVGKQKKGVLVGRQQNTDDRLQTKKIPGNHSAISGDLIIGCPIDD